MASTQGWNSSNISCLLVTEEEEQEEAEVDLTPIMMLHLTGAHCVLFIITNCEACFSCVRVEWPS